MIFRLLLKRQQITNHFLKKHEPKGYYQLSHSSKTEWAGVAVDRQREMLKKGLEILKNHNLNPSCFFAPCHTYDIYTVKVVADEGLYISDGYALHPYTKDGARFLPSLFDRPINCIIGDYTFVYHPNNMNERDYKYLESFLRQHATKFVTADYIMKTTDVRGQGFVGKMLEFGVYVVRGLRNRLNSAKQYE